jgi:hypothetical protein
MDRQVTTGAIVADSITLRTTSGSAADVHSPLRHPRPRTRALVRGLDINLCRVISCSCPLGRALHCLRGAQMNGDGHVDLYMNNDQEQNNQIFLGDGTGAFTEVQVGAAVSSGGKSQRALAADFNNDGIVDLYVQNWMQRNQMFIGNGDASFVAALDTLPSKGAHPTNDAEAADFNGDGLLDLYVSNGTPSPQQLYLGQALAGSFTVRARVGQSSILSVSHSESGCVVLFHGRRAH